MIYNNRLGLSPNSTVDTTTASPCIKHISVHSQHEDAQWKYMSKHMSCHVHCPMTLKSYPVVSCRCSLVCEYGYVFSSIFKVLPLTVHRRRLPSGMRTTALHLPEHPEHFDSLLSGWMTDSIILVLVHFYTAFSINLCLYNMCQLYEVADHDYASIARIRRVVHQYSVVVKRQPTLMLNSARHAYSRITKSNHTIVHFRSVLLLCPGKMHVSSHLQSLSGVFCRVLLWRTGYITLCTPYFIFYGVLA